jgi:hypothetical protein
MMYLRNLVGYMRLPAVDSTSVFEDKTACIEWSNRIMGGRERAKHMDMRKHLAHEAEWPHSLHQDSDGVSAG